MFNVLEARLQQKKRTIAYPKSKPVLPDRFRGRPIILRELCSADCRACAEVCPTVDRLSILVGASSVASASRRVRIRRSSILRNIGWRLERGKR
jgi:formate hydrogenlyase subunit 6/NADH:ubiquinone oxidoreductase subunit I